MNSLLTASPGFPELAAEQLVARHYGITGTAARLPAEQGDNFQIGTGYVLRVGHPAQDDEVVRLQVRALRHLAAADPELPVPQVITTLTGQAEVPLRDPDRLAVLTTFLPGQLLESATTSTALWRELGATLARMNLALRSFTDPAASHELLWDIQRAYLLRDLTGDADLLRWLDHFDDVVRPALAGLRAQVVHNDFSRDNVLVDGVRVTGILDFGDMVHTYLAADVAVAACYQLDDGASNPAGPAVDLIAGYHVVDPLTGPELELLYDLIVTRLAARIIIPEWRAARFPDNSAYVLRNTKRSRALFGRLAGLARGDFTGRVMAACGMAA
jgi:hydroxylysine kinase